MDNIDDDPMDDIDNFDDIDDIMFEGGGWFNDDGTKIDVDQIPIPLLCLSCKKFGVRSEHGLCTLNRAGQKDSKHFECGAYSLE